MYNNHEGLRELQRRLQALNELDRSQVREFPTSLHLNDPELHPEVRRFIDRQEKYRVRIRNVSVGQYSN